MTLTDEVLDDLLTLYLAGEASEASRRLVEDYLARRPDKAEAARQAGIAVLPAVAPPPSVERKALDRTRGMISHRQSFFGVGLIFSLLPCSFTFDGGRIGFLMIRDAPIIGWTWLGVGLAMWVGFVITCRQLRATGLQTTAWWPLWAAVIAGPWMAVLWIGTGSPAAVLAPIAAAGAAYAAGRWVTAPAIAEARSSGRS